MTQSLTLADPMHDCYWQSFHRKNTYICHTYITEVEELWWGVYLTSSLLHLFVPYITILIRSTFCCSLFLVAQFMVGCLLWMWRNFCHLFFTFHMIWFFTSLDFILWTSLFYFLFFSLNIYFFYGFYSSYSCFM